MNRKKIEQGMRMILEGIGEDPGRPGLLETPRRVADLYQEVFSGIGVDANRRHDREIEPFLLVF